MSLIIQMPEATLFENMPESRRDQVKSVKAVYTPYAMPNSRGQGGLKIMDALVDDSFLDIYEANDLPAGWTVIYLARLIEGDPKTWEEVVARQSQYLEHLTDIYDMGGRPTVAYEGHRYAGLPKRW